MDMYYSYLVFVFILGLIAGSFINVLILRRSTGKTIMGRSKCASCGHLLSALDLIPLFSFVLLRRKCRYCNTKISAIYPLIELGTGFIFLLLALHFDFSSFRFIPYSLFLIQLVFWSLAFAVSVYDLRHTIIPNSWTLTLSVLAVIYALTYSGNLFLTSILSGIIFALFFFALWLVSAGKWMGLGDAKFAFALGTFIGLNKLFSAWALSFWIGATCVLVYFSIDSVLRSGGKKINNISQPLNMKSEVPFGPFLFIGSFLAFLGLILPIYGF